MISDFAVGSEHPGGLDELASLIDVAATEVDPSKRVPIRADGVDATEVVDLQAFDVDVAELRGDFGYCRFSVLLRAIELQIVVGELIGDVIPDGGVAAKLDRFVEGIE